MTSEQEEALIDLMYTRVHRLKELIGKGEYSKDILWNYLEDILDVCKCCGLDQAIIDNLDNELSNLIA